MTAICDDSCCGGGALPHEEALRELGRFALGWELESVLGPWEGRAWSRPAVARAIGARARRDAVFRAELFRHPRWVYMVAMEEAFRISKVAFLRQVREVRALAETPEILYLVLPIEAALEARFWGVDPPRDEPASESPREAVERRLLAGAEAEGPQRQALLFEPQATYLAAARELGGGELPAYLRDVRELRVVPETPTALALVVPVADAASG